MTIDINYIGSDYLVTEQEEHDAKQTSQDAIIESLSNQIDAINFQEADLIWSGSQPIYASSNTTIDLTTPFHEMDYWGFYIELLADNIDGTQSTAIPAYRHIFYPRLQDQSPGNSTDGYYSITNPILWVVPYFETSGTSGSIRITTLQCTASFVKSGDSSTDLYDQLFISGQNSQYENRMYSSSGSYFYTATATTANTRYKITRIFGIKRYESG